MEHFRKLYGERNLKKTPQFEKNKIMVKGKFRIQYGEKNMRNLVW